MTTLVSFVPLVEIDLNDRFRAARMAAWGRSATVDDEPSPILPTNGGHLTRRFHRLER